MPLFFIVLAQYKTVKMMLPSYVCICWPSVKLNICFLSRRGSVSLLRYKLIIYHWIKYHLFHVFHSFIIHEILPELLKYITNLLSRSRCRFKLLSPKSVKFCQRVLNFAKECLILPKLQIMVTLLSSCNVLINPFKFKVQAPQKFGYTHFHKNVASVRFELGSLEKKASTMITWPPHPRHPTMHLYPPKYSWLGYWMWHNWQKSCFRHLRSAVRIQTTAKFTYTSTVSKRRK